MTRAEWMSVNAASMAELRGRYGNRCGICGSTKRLEFTHAAPTGLCSRGRGIRNRYFDILAHPECYALVCRSCHKGEDFRHSRGMDVLLPTITLPILARRSSCPT